MILPVVCLLHLRRKLNLFWKFNFLFMPLIFEWCALEFLEKTVNGVAIRLFIQIIIKNFYDHHHIIIITLS